MSKPEDQKQQEQKKRPGFQVITKHESILMNRLGTYIMNHPGCPTKEVVDYFSEYKEEAIKSCLTKLIASGHLKFTKMNVDSKN